MLERVNVTATPQKRLPWNSWYGFMAPAGTPKEIIERLHGEVVKIMRMPDIVEKLRQSGLDVEATTPEQHAAKIKSDLERWTEIVKAVDLKPN